MKTAYSFVRWSTRGQGRDSADSKRRQLQTATDWCKENGFQLSKQVFIGAGESGFRGKHLKKDEKTGVAIGALARFIEAVEKGNIKSGSVLLIDSVDRFSRQEITKALAPLTKLLDLGIGIVFTGSYYRNKIITNELLNKEPHWLQVVISDMIRSWNESDEKSRKIKESKKRKRLEIQKGKPVTHNNSPRYFSWNKSIQEYEHNENTKIVLDMVDQFLAGKTLYGIARGFNAKHVPTLRVDSAWSSNAVRCILKNRSLIGEFFGNPKFFPPIISKDRFNAIQVLLSQNPNFNSGREGTLFNVFRGTAFCLCGKSMNVLTQRIHPHTKKPHEVPYRYLRCSTKGMGKGCAHTHVLPTNDMELEFFGNFLLKDPAELVADKTKSKEVASKISKVQIDVANIGKQIAGMLDDPEIKMVPEVKAKIAKLNQERETKKSVLDELVRQQNTLETAPGHFDDLKKLCFGLDADLNSGAITMDKYGKLTVTEASRKFAEAMNRMIDKLRVNATRWKIWTLLPTLIGKIVVDTRNKSWQVFNHSGKCIYTSLVWQF